MAFLVPSLPTWLNTAAKAGPSSTEESRSNEKDYDDTPPQFPLPGSAQRSQVPNSINVPTFEIDEPEHIDDDDEDNDPPTPKAQAQAPAPASSLPAPTTTTKKPTHYPGAPPAPANSIVGKKRRKIALAPGCSPLDWARLKSSGQDLRGIPSSALDPFGGGYLRVTMEELKKHNTKSDAWSAFHGKVYNITQYVRFHPGGEEELLRVAGRDGTKLFMLTHAWVNVDYMLDSCLIGFLVPG